MYINYSYFRGNSIPTPVPDTTALLHYDANITTSYPKSGSIIYNVGSIGNTTATQLNIISGSYKYIDEGCSLLSLGSLNLSSSYNQPSSSTWLFCLYNQNFSEIFPTLAQYDLIGYGNPNLFKIFHVVTKNYLNFYSQGSELPTIPQENYIAAAATGSFITIAVRRTQATKVTELLSSFDNFTTAYPMSGSTSLIQDLYNNSNNVTELGSTFQNVPDIFSIKSIKLYNSALNTSQLLAKANCPNCLT